MFKFIAKLGVIGLMLALMVYSSIRTYDFLVGTLPVGSEALAIFGVMAFDAALIIWLLVFMFDAEGAGQRGIAAAMVVFQLVAILAGFGGDSLLRSAENGLIAALDLQTRQLILYLTIAVIFVNVAAVTFYHLLSPGNRARMRQEGYAEKIENKAHEKADLDVDMLAAQLAQDMSDSTIRQLTAKYQSMIVDQELKANQQEEKNGIVQSVRDALKSTFKPDGNSGTTTLASEGEPVTMAAEPAKKGRPKKS